jgi:class 3 adenylate cyclase/tetratricopeptide (TPR) repeat protein
VTESEREFRKVVTVLFCDLVGSTQLGESTDPETLRTRMRRYFADIRATIERHGGTVEKFIGDAVMAVFGVPVAREDDALRAVRAAEEIRAAVAAHGFEARIGVNTGEVVAGGEGETLAVGDAVNVAARLEQHAGPGEILIGTETRLLVRDAVRVADVEPLELKGKSDPVAAFRLLKVIEGADPLARTLAAPMVGRARERDRLHRDFEDAVADRACRLFTLLGPAGVGKSRLVEDFLERVDGAADVLRGRCLHYGEGITYWPLVELLGSTGVSPETVVAATPEETNVAFRRLLEKRAAERPQVVVIDDLQWAEPTFLDLVEHVADLSRGEPIFLLCIARPELLDIRPGWGGGKLNTTSLLLEPLGADDCNELIERLRAGDDLDAATRERIASASGGNPLFVEEMVAVFRERGDVAVPSTIHALLQARLDTLPEGERLVVGRAAVEGQVFHTEAVAALLPERLRGEINVLVASLIRKEFVRPEPGDAFRFRHLLIRDAAYAALPKELRADLHARFSAWLERATEPTLELDEILGYHLEQAFRLRVALGLDGDTERKLANAAGEKLVSAGLAAYQRGDMRAAIALLRRTRDLLGDDQPRRADALRVLGQALMRRGEFADAEEAFRAALSAAAAAGDRSTEIRAQLLLGDLASRTDPTVDTESGLALALELAAELETSDDPATLSFAYEAVGMCRFVLGHAAAGEADLARAADIARRAGALPEEHRALNALLRPKLWGPARADDVLATCDAILDRDDVGLGLRVHALQVRAVAAALLGDEAGARDAGGRAGALIEEYDLRLQRGMYGVDFGFALELCGDLHSAEAELRRGYEALKTFGATGALTTLCGELATVLAWLERLDDAESIAAEGRSLAGADDFDAQTRWRKALARARLVRGDLEEAERLAREAVAVVSRTDFITLEAEAEHVLGEVLAARKRSAEAEAAFERALVLYERKGNVVGAREARALLEAAATPS